MKASELIEVIRRKIAQHGDREIAVTTEGLVDPVASVYLGKDGELLIDGDGDSFKPQLAADPSEF